MYEIRRKQRIGGFLLAFEIGYALFHWNRSSINRMIGKYCFKSLRKTRFMLHGAAGRFSDFSKEKGRIMMTFTDLHSHIAWDVDDGCSCIEETTDALSMAKEDGILHIASTPHIIPGYTSKEEIADIRERQEELKELAASMGITVYSAGEIRLNENFLNGLLNNLYPVINNGPYMLVEFCVNEDFSSQAHLADLLYEIKVRKMIPVIAHVERYFHKKLDFEVLDEWMDAGFVFQINATSLRGEDSPRSKKNAWTLLKKGYAHLVATDTHHASGRRIEELSSVYDAIAYEIGEDAAELLLVDNPQAILRGEEVEDLEPTEKPKSKLWFWK